MNKGLNKMRELLVILIASLAFGLYVICPRMSAQKSFYQLEKHG